jgi:hypothetical protein
VIQGLSLVMHQKNSAMDLFEVNDLLIKQE